MGQCHNVTEMTLETIKHQRINQQRNTEGDLISLTNYRYSSIYEGQSKISEHCLITFKNYVVNELRAYNLSK